MVKKLSNGLGELSFPLLLRSSTDEGQFQSVFIIEPFETGRELPDIIRIHACRIFPVGHEKNALLLIRSIYGQDPHHHKIGYNTQGQNRFGLWEGMHIIPNQSHDGEETGDGTDDEATIN